MKTFGPVLSALAMLWMIGTAYAQVSITPDGSAPDNSAMLDVKSTTRGLLLPRMTSTEMNAITSPVPGLMLYNTTDGNFYFYTGSAWNYIVGSSDNDWIISGSNEFPAVSGNIGIGTTAPSEKLHVYSGEVRVETNPGQNWIELSQGSVVTDASAGSTSRYITSIGNTMTWGLGKTHTGNNNFHLANYPGSRWDMTVLTSNGYVGINNQSPSQRLDVNGNMRLAGSLYDVNNQPGSSGQLLSSAPSGTDWIDPPNDNDWVISSTNMSSGVTGNVGIGTTDPTEKLHVYSGEVRVETNPGQNWIELSQGSVVTDASAGSTSRYITSIGNTMTWGLGKTHTGNNNFHLANYPGSRWDMTVLTSNGYVGINNQSPSQRLDVNGNMRLAGSLYDVNNQPGSSGQLLSSAPSGTDWIDPPNDNDWVISSTNMSSGVSGNVGIGTTAPSEKLHVYSGEVRVETNPGQNYIELSQGSVVTDATSGSTSRYITSIGSTMTWGLGKTHTGNNNFHLTYYPGSRWDVTVLTSNGYVGINNQSPSQRLDINGNMHLSGAFYDGTNQPGTSEQILSTTGSTTDWITPAALLDIMDQNPVAPLRTLPGKIEDFGNAKAAGGMATVSLEELFAGYADLTQPYLVFLTPLSDSPVQLTVSEKKPENFSVRAFDKNGNPVDCEFDYRVVAKLKK